MRLKPSVYILLPTENYSEILSDLASTQTMQDEIKLLNEKVDYLNEGNRKLHASCETRIQKLQNKLNQKETLMDQCQSGNQDAFITRKELDSCRDELTDEQDSKQQIYQNLQNAKQNIKTLEDENKRHSSNIETLKDEQKILQNQLNLEKAENDNLGHQIRQLKNEKSIEVRNLNNQNQKLQNSLESCQNRLKSIQSELDQCQISNYWNPVLNRIQQLEHLPLSEYDLWHEHFVNGEYVIAYELNDDLDYTLQRMIPKVSLEFRLTFIRYES